jgi:hypothetical protein
VRVCFLGNSHLLPVASAWKREPRGLEATFIGAPGGELKGLAISDGKLTPSCELRAKLTGIGNVAEATLSDFDAFVIVGLHFTVARCAQLFASHRAWRLDGEAAAGADGRPLASRRRLVASTRESLRQIVAMSLAAGLRRVTPAPVLLLAQPGMSERVLEVDSGLGELWRALHERGCEPEVRSIYDEARAELAGEEWILDQPAETIANDILTAGPYDFWQRGKPQDHFHLAHMNVEYDHLALRDLVERALA